MSRIVLHWTAGSYVPSDVDLDHYHVLLAGNGSPHRGHSSIADNVDCTDDDYAAHTRGCNTRSIGLTVCCAFNARTSAGRVEWGPYPPTREQWNSLIRAAADLCRTYRIPPDPRHLLTHYEVETVLKIQQRGKWDLKFLPWPLLVGYRSPAEELRARVKQLLGTG